MKRWTRATALCAVVTLSLAACGGGDDDASDTETGAEETTTTEAEAEETTTTEDEGGAEASELEPTGDTVEYAGATVEVTSASTTPDEYDEDSVGLEMEVDLTNDTDDKVDFYAGATLVVDGEDFDLSGAEYVAVEPGKKTSIAYTASGVPADASWDDMVLEFGDDSTVRAVYPLTSAPEESPLPVTLTPDETREVIDETDTPHSMVIDSVTRTLDSTNPSGTVVRAPAGTSFLVFEASITSGVDSPYIATDFFRMEGAGEVNEPEFSSAGSYQDPNTVKKYSWTLILPDDADDAVVRIGSPKKDPNFEKWPVPFDELGGEISDGMGEGSSDSDDDEDADSDDADASTTTTRDEDDES